MCVLGMTMKANTGKRRNVYNSTVGPAYVDYPQDASDLAQESPYGVIDLNSDEFYQIHALSSRHPPSSSLAVHQNHLSGPFLNNQDPKSPSKGMMNLSIYHHRSTSC